MNGDKKLIPVRFDASEMERLEAYKRTVGTVKTNTAAVYRLAIERLEQVEREKAAQNGSAAAST